MISQSEDRESQLVSQLEEKQRLLEDLQQKTQDLNNLILKYVHGKERKMVEILTLQTRAKWYRAVKAKKYKMSVENDDMALNEIVALRDQNSEIKKIIDMLNQDYPFYKRNLQKAVVMLSD